MTTENKGRKPIESETGQAQGEPPSTLYGAPFSAMQPDEDYRVLESSYRRSAEYAAMVERYPLLRSWITACASSELVGHPPAIAGAAESGVTLQWERSHGE